MENRYTILRVNYPTLIRGLLVSHHRSVLTGPQALLAVPVKGPSRWDLDSQPANQDITSGCPPKYLNPLSMHPILKEKGLLAVLRIKHRTLLRGKEVRGLLKQFKDASNLLHQAFSEENKGKVQVERIVLEDKTELFLVKDRF